MQGPSAGTRTLRRTLAALAALLIAAPLQGQSDPISTYSSLSYAAVGALPLNADFSASAGVMASTLTALSVGSWQMHQTRNWGRWPAWEGVDHAAMHSTYAALAGHSWGLPWWATLGVAVTAPVVEIAWDGDIERSMAVYAGVTALAGMTRGKWRETLSGFALMGAALAVRDRGDLGHGLWHVLTAAGTRILSSIGGQDE